MLKEFREFLLRGNIVELAVAFVMGVAFGAVINSLVDNLVMPIVAMIIGKPDFSGLTFTINDAVFRYGAFLTDVITFVATAAAIFFFVVDRSTRSCRASDSPTQRRSPTRSAATRSSWPPCAPGPRRPGSRDAAVARRRWDASRARRARP